MKGEILRIIHSYVQYQKFDRVNLIKKIYNSIFCTDIITACIVSVISSVLVYSVILGTVLMIIYYKNKDQNKGLK